MWRNLVKTALIGTDKSTPSVSTLDTLEGMGVKTDDIAQTVLQGVGILSLMRKGGFPLMDFNGALPEACETEIEQFCSTQSVQHLKEILTGKHSEAMGEFAFYAQQYKKIMPPEILPQLLHFSRSNKQLWAIVRPIIGKRGEWLLKQNSDWKHLEKQMAPETPIGFGQLTNEETLKQAREIATLLNNNRLIWASEKKITTQLKSFAYFAAISLSENLNYFFLNELGQVGNTQIEEVYKIFFFRKEAINALNC